MLLHSDANPKDAAAKWTCIPEQVHERVLRILWIEIIYQCWSRDDAVSLARACPHLIPIIDVQWLTSDRGIRAKVTRRLQTDGSFEKKLNAAADALANVEAIVSSRRYDKLMKRAEWFPNHQDHTIDRLAATVFAHESMLRMEVDSFKEVRRKELKAVLDSVGCISLKNEAWLMIEEFISGRVCISAKEVAASVRVAETLLDVVGDVNDVDVWDKFAGEWCEDVMHEHIYKGVWTWENAPERLKELKAFGEMVWDLEVALGL